MAIGDVKLKTGRSLPQQENIVPGMFGEGVAKAVSNIGNAIGDVATLTAGLHERANKTEEFETQKKFIEYEGEQKRLHEEELRNTAPGATGITNAVQERAAANNQAFLETVPKRLQPQYTSLLENLNQEQINKSFAFEYEEGNKLFRKKVVELTDDQASKVRGGELDLTTAKDNLIETIKLSDLPELEKELQITKATQALVIADYARQVTASLVMPQPVREVTPGKAEPDVVLSGTGPGVRGLANTIAKGESGSRYDVRYDGSASGATFTDYSDHPRVAVGTSDGNVSTAAGKYQITAPTWDMAAAALGLPDFSPANQDKAFTWLAEQRFKKVPELEGHTLESALTSNDTEILAQVHEALKPEWVYLDKLSTEEFIKEVQEGTLGPDGKVSVPGAAAGAVGTPERPDLWNEDNGLTYAQRSAIYNDSVIKSKAAITAQRKQAKEQHEAQYNSAVMDASRGVIGLADEAALREAGVLSKYTEVTAFRRAIDDWKTRVSTTEELQSKFNNPDHVFTGSENKAWNNLFGEEGKDQLSAMDQNYLNTAFTPVVQRIGYIPSESAKVLETMVTTGNLQQRAFALDTLSTYHGQNPQILERTSGMSEGMKKTVGQYTMLKPFYSESEITEKFKQLRDPVFAKQHAELVGAGRKAFRAEVTTPDMLDAFDTAFAYEPTVPLTAGQQNVFRQEFETLYAEGYALNQDHDTAMEYATKQMGRQWSVSSLGGENRMMRNAPEVYYPTINGDHSWLDYTVLRDLGLPSGSEYSLVPDGQTRKEAETFQKTGKGNNASYMIGIKDVEGNYGLKMDETGTAPLRIAFDPQDPELVEGINWITSYTNLTQKTDDLMSRYVSLKNWDLKRDQAEISLVEGLLDEQLASAETMRKSRIGNLSGNPMSVTHRLVADMEREAQLIYTNEVFGLKGPVPSKAIKDHYNRLVLDLKHLGGKIPGETTNPAETK